MALKWFLSSGIFTEGLLGGGDAESDNSTLTLRRTEVLAISPEAGPERVKGLKDRATEGGGGGGATSSASCGFQMPLHYPRYKKGDYEKMEEWKLDCLVTEYGLRFEGALDQKRAFAVGTFLWPGQY